MDIVQIDAKSPRLFQFQESMVDYRQSKSSSFPQGKTHCRDNRNELDVLYNSCYRLWVNNDSHKRLCTVFTIAERIHHIEYASFYMFYSPYETWYGYVWLDEVFYQLK
jgi:hypothetical protein